MLQRTGDFEQWQLQAAARDYIPLYARGDVAEVPYKDVPTGTVQYVQFIFVDGNWLYVDNTQEG